MWGKVSGVCSRVDWVQIPALRLHKPPFPDLKSGLLRPPASIVVQMEIIAIASTMFISPGEKEAG